MDLVVDCGSSCLKAGWAGDDSPVVVTPSASAGSSQTTEVLEVDPGERNQPRFSVSRGRVVDWEAMLEVWGRLEELINTKIADVSSVLVVETPKAGAVADRKLWGEKLFETFGAPSVCLMNSAPLVLFAAGRTSGVAVDLGAGLTSAVPVYEGVALEHASLFMDFGGQDITSRLQTLLGKMSINIDFAYSRFLKERMATVAPQQGGRRPLKAANVSCFLPDGMEVTYIDIDYSQLPGTEISVEPSVFSDCCEALLHQSTHPHGLFEQVHQSISLCDSSIRAEIASNVVIAGGRKLTSDLSII